MCNNWNFKINFDSRKPKRNSTPDHGYCKLEYLWEYSEATLTLGQKKNCYIGVTRPTLKLGPTLHLKKKKKKKKRKTKKKTTNRSLKQGCDFSGLFRISGFFELPPDFFSYDLFS